jgi:hypothetical protein
LLNGFGAANCSNRVLSTLTPNNALDPVEGRYAGPNIKLGCSIIAVSRM